MHVVSFLLLSLSGVVFTVYGNNGANFQASLSVLHLFIHDKNDRHISVEGEKELRREVY